MMKQKLTTDTGNRKKEQQSSRAARRDAPKKDVGIEKRFIAKIKFCKKLQKIAKNFRWGYPCHHEEKTAQTRTTRRRSREAQLDRPEEQLPTSRQKEREGGEGGEKLLPTEAGEIQEFFRPKEETPNTQRKDPN